jgi:hypothetical protein
VDIPQDQIEELKLFCVDARPHQEGEVPYVYLPGLRLPDGCSPTQIDALLCPTPAHGYTSRLLFAQPFTSPQSRNWHYNARVLERNWAAISWNIPAGGLRLAQVLAEHLRAFR